MINTTWWLPAAGLPARLGAKVLLAEATGCLGGMGTSGLVTAFNPMADGERVLVGGFMRELVESMYQCGFLAPHVTPDFWRKRGVRLVQDMVPYSSTGGVRQDRIRVRRLYEAMPENHDIHCVVRVCG